VTRLAPGGSSGVLTGALRPAQASIGSRGYALNLSILISAGKENNSDSLSSGERNGRSPRLNLLRGDLEAKCGLWKALSERRGSKLLGTVRHRG